MGFRRKAFTGPQFPCSPCDTSKKLMRTAVNERSVQIILGKKRKKRKKKENQRCILASQTCMMGRFTKIVNGYKFLTIFDKKLHHSPLTGF